MNTPIFDFVKAYAQADTSRFHMPGHKGQPFLGCEPLDITEIDGADVLYSANGIIHESECYASELFGTAHSFYSTEGSSLCIKAMLALAAMDCPQGQKPLILAARNAHKAFIYACALLDLRVTWLCPDTTDHLCACVITPQDVQDALDKADPLPTAVYLTSPDYLGKIADVAGIAKVCHAHGVPLLIDNAHGAYLHFLQPSAHPIALGADLCCDSAHKTLPVLTGGAYLHVSRNALRNYTASARDVLSVFASTSPSYLILQSLDLCNRYLADNYRNRLSACVQKTTNVKQAIADMGWRVEESEPLKLVLRTRDTGYTGEELAARLRESRVACEFADDTYLVLMITPETRDLDFERLLRALRALPKKAPLENITLPHPICADAPLTPRQAIFSPREQVTPENAIGRICATPTVSCPPAIPLVISGERITQDTAALFCRYGIDHVQVVKE